MLVGRRLVISALCSAVDTAVGGAGGVTLLAGEAGMGKTALASEAVAYAKARGAVAVWGTCWEGDGAPGFWPWIQVVRALARDGDEAGQAVLARRLARLPGEVAHLLAVASVVGRRFPIAMAAAAADTAAEAAVPLVDRAVRAAVLEQDGPGRAGSAMTCSVRSCTTGCRRRGGRRSTSWWPGCWSSTPAR